jgi:O-antigen/teichoic acid export membrane protein
MLTIALTYIFTRMFGVGGAALGPLLSTSCIVSPYVMWRVGGILGIRPGKLLWSGTGRALLHSLPPAVALLACAWLLPRAWGWGWLLAVGFASILLNLAMFDLAILWRTRGTPWSGRLRLLFEAR